MRQYDTGDDCMAPDNRGKVMFNPFFGGLNGDDYGPMFCGDEYDDSPQYEPSPVKCRSCGDTNVHWHQYPSGKWFIFDDDTNQPHKCKPKEPVIKIRVLKNREKKSTPKLISIEEQYKNAARCPHCGTKVGFAPGTGDCGCETTFEVGW